MDKNEIDYAELIDDAMHAVVRKTLKHVQKNGLPGEHHFFITFKTGAAGVMIADELRKKYPDEMTIVVQHQFFDLEVEEKYFSIVLSFDHVKQNLTIPFNSMTSFVDPSVRFGLQFSLPEAEEETPKSTNSKKPKVDNGKNISNVVSFDSFRKNNGKNDG